MGAQTSRLHHVTAIGGAPQRNVDLSIRSIRGLGLRLVKKTVTSTLRARDLTSIYLREPGGVLFPIATDTPGFSIDEPLLELGRSLKLPPWLEPSREQIEHAIAPRALPDENNPSAPTSVDHPSAP